LDTRLGNLLFIGAAICTIVSLFMIYRITVTGDPNQEWIIWISVTIGFILFGGSFLMDRKNKPIPPPVP
jgi:uncharacterized membrane protein